MTPISIVLVQLLYLCILYVPMGWPRLGLPRGTRIGMGYLAANALALIVGYLLDMAGVFSAPRQFAVWLGIGLALNLLAWRHVPARRLARGERAIYGWLAMALALTAWIRLADPLQNVALAGGDSYHFANFFYWILGEQKAIHNYPSGFALVAAMAPWTLPPYEATRWSPHVVYVACQMAAFGFWRRLGGLRFAGLIALLLCTAWFLYPLTAYHPHFIQWTFSFAGIPALLFIYSRLVRKPSVPLVLLGILANLAFAMTAGYFALYANVVLLLLAAGLVPKNRAALKTLASTAGVALVPPLALLIFYGILVRVFFTEWPAGLTLQAQDISVASQLGSGDPAPVSTSGWTGLWNHPLTAMVVRFLSPALPLRIGARWVAYAGLILLGIWLWRRCRTPRHLTVRLLAGTLLISVFSAMTGIFELPAWEGRNVFISLYAGVALGTWAALRLFPRPARKFFRSPWLLALGIAAVAGPALVWPPMIGHNVPIATVVRPRVLPTDNRVLGELNRTIADPGQRKTMAVIPSWDPPADLIVNLLRLHKHTRANLFPAYRLEALADMDSAEDCAGVLAAETLYAGSPLASNFVPRVHGTHFIFALRKSTENP